MKRFHRIKKDIGNFVLSKYEHKCTECGNTNNLCVHHIIKMNPTDENYNDIDNLTVLCRSCHMSHHRKEGDIKPPKNTSKGNSYKRNPYGRRGKIPPIKCKIIDCDNFQHGRELCKKHYEQLRRKGLLKN